jgi:hypothetical protein
MRDALSCAAFVAQLRERLAPAGVDLVSAELGRDASGPVWVVTAHGPRGVATMHAAVNEGHAYARWTCDGVAARVTDHLNG